MLHIFKWLQATIFFFNLIFFFRWLIKSFNILLSRPKFRKHLTKWTSPHVIAYLLTGLKRIRKATLGLTQNDINEIITLPLSSSHNKFSTWAFQVQLLILTAHIMVNLPISRIPNNVLSCHAALWSLKNESQIQDSDIDI